MSHYREKERLITLIGELNESIQSFSEKAKQLLESMEGEYEDVEEEKVDAEDEAKELKEEIESLEEKIESMKIFAPNPRMTVRDEFMAEYLVAVSKKFTLQELEFKLGSYNDIVI